MIDLDEAELCFRPSRSRYWLVGPFFAVEGLFFLAMLTFFASLIADGVQRGPAGWAILSIFMGFALVWLCAFATNYVRNAATLSIELNQNAIRVHTWNQKSSVKILDVRKICFLDTMRGWMYIIIYTEYGYSVISNLMYFDKEFNNIRTQVTGWFAKIGKADLIYTDSVTQAGLTRNKKLPPFIYGGMWRCGLAYASVLIALTIACLFTGFRPAAILRAH